MLAAGPEVLDNGKATEPTPVKLALTMYGPPAFVFAVNDTVAVPVSSVKMDVILVPSENVPLGSFPGAANVTFAPGTPTPLTSCTIACSGDANVVPTRVR